MVKSVTNGSEVLMYEVIDGFIYITLGIAVLVVAHVLGFFGALLII